MLRSQIYSLVDDRTMVDRELDELRYAWQMDMQYVVALEVNDVLLMVLQFAHKSSCCPDVLSCADADSIIQSGS